MKSAVASAIFFAASIALAVAYPSRSYYRPVSYDDGEYSSGRSLWTGQQPSYTLASAPFYYQPRNLDLEETDQRGRKYKIVKKKKNQGAPGSGSDEEEDDEPQDDDDDDESSEEEQDEEEDEEQSLDTPSWEKLFPEEDKNTGSKCLKIRLAIVDEKENSNRDLDGFIFLAFDDQGGASPGYEQGGGGQAPSGYGGQSPSGYGGQGSSGYSGGGSLANIPGGAPAPQGSGSLMSFFTGGNSGGSSGNSGSEGHQSEHGGPPQYRQGPPPQYRGRSSLEEEPRSGGAVLYDGYRYIPVKPVHVQLGQRQAKKIKPKQQKKVKTQGRSLRTSAAPSSSSRQNKKISNNSNKKIVLVQVPPRDSREIRFSRDEDGFRVESGPMYAPTEIWRWEGPGGRPLRRRENRPSGLYYAPRPQRGSASSVRFAEENDY